ncbi:hypothetical protein [Sphingomonas sp. UV9]|uniref:hypothetical protein n=1 Tax=Sphingomonas sp. UV9 TaxID=1851410 RepID=UPI0019CF6C05|nr:hypothetical protein [Sphingomonas sp. UV9]
MTGLIVDRRGAMLASIATGAGLNLNASGRADAAPSPAGSGAGRCSTPQKARRPVEFHLYQAGGHGVGLGKAGTTSTGWFEDFMHRRDANTLLAMGEGERP